MKTLNLFMFGLAIIVTANSCIEDISIEGNGIQASEGRIVSDFERVNSSGDFTVHITNGPYNDIVVSTDENVLLSGSGRINAAFEAEELKAVLSGSGKVISKN